MAIRGRAVKSIKTLKSDLKKGSAGGDVLTRIKADTDLMIRFLTEPDGWVDYAEHYSQTHHYFPCDASACIGCEEGLRTSTKYAIPALDVDNEKVILLSVGRGLADDIIKKYDHRNTIMDRDYTIQREGSTQDDTNYYLHEEDRKKRNLSKYKVPSQNEILKMMEPLVPRESEDDADDEEMDAISKPRGKRSSRDSGSAKKKASTRRVRDEDDDDEDDEPRGRRPIKRAVKPVKKAGKTLGRR